MYQDCVVWRSDKKSWEIVQCVSPFQKVLVLYELFNELHHCSSYKGREKHHGIVSRFPVMINEESRGAGSPRRLWFWTCLTERVRSIDKEATQDMQLLCNQRWVEYKSKSTAAGRNRGSGLESWLCYFFFMWLGNSLKVSVI